MINPVNNRCKQYFANKNILYQPFYYSEIEKKLNVLAEKCKNIIVVYSPVNNSNTLVKTGGNLTGATCEKAVIPGNESYSNVIKLFFKEKKHTRIFTDGDFINSGSIGIIRWVGPLEQYDRLNFEGYFRNLLQADI